jgi:hypothetical protein
VRPRLLLRRQQPRLRPLRLLRAAPRTCPGVAAEEARYAAVLAAKRAEDARTLSRRARLGATYRAMVLSTFAVRRINP